MRILERGTFLELAVNSNQYVSILQLVGLELPSMRALFELHSHGRGVTAMMPAVIWQTQLTWDRKAPGSYGGAPKATFYNLAGELQCEVRRGVRSKLGRRTPWPYPTWLLCPTGPDGLPQSTSE